MSNPTYYLSIGANGNSMVWGLTDEWGKKQAGNYVMSGGYYVVMLDRTNPDRTPHLDKLFTDPDEMLSAIASTLSANDGNCILLIMAAATGLEYWGYSLDFIQEFENFGAGDIYKSIIQDALLLTGSGDIAAYQFYTMATVPIDNGAPGYERGKVDGNYGHGADTVSQAFELVPLPITPVEYTLRLIG